VKITIKEEVGIKYLTKAMFIITIFRGMGTSPMNDISRKIQVR